MALRHPLQLLGFENFAKGSAVRIGDLWHHARTVEITLHRHCKKIFGVTDYEGAYGFPGSSTALKFGNCRLLFCCGHQRKTICGGIKLGFVQLTAVAGS